MAETIKSALFVDYDSIHRSIAAGEDGAEAADRLAERSAEWVAAIESGRLLLAKSGSSERRRVLIRRVYADPRLLGAQRSSFIASGFEVIDSPVLEGRSRNGADVSLSLDVVDALGHPTGYDEFILLSADIDLTPLLSRLRAHNRTTVIYATESTPAAYRAIPDAVFDEVGLAQLLQTQTVPIPVPSEATPTPSVAAPVAGERADIEVLARKIHNATSVPLFSPRAFADLFRILAQEIAENGYHFQNTAENVANKLTASGRSVTRRQVVFVVKGLALKGHVFSTTDTAEKLAEVFREQVLYLVGNSGLELDEREKSLLPAWIAGRAPAASPPPPPAPPPPSPPRVAEPEAKPVQAEEPKPAKRKAAKPPPSPPAKSAPVAAKPAAAPPPPRPAPKPVETVAEKPAPAPPKPAPVRPPPVVAPPTPTRSIEEIKAAVAARAAAMKAAATTPPPAQPKPASAGPARPASPPATTPPAPPRPAPAAAPPPPAAPPRQAPPTAAERPAPKPPARPAPPPAARPAAPANKEALESSILAAIAQAVDVLVEDSGANKGQREAEAPPLESPAVPETKPAPAPATAETGDGGDIGDEIQRIIASYSRARQQGEPQ